MACTEQMRQTQGSFNPFHAKLEVLRSLGLHTAQWGRSSSLLVAWCTLRPSGKMPPGLRGAGRKTTLIHTDLWVKPAQHHSVPMAVHSLPIPRHIFTFPCEWKEIYTPAAKSWLCSDGTATLQNNWEVSVMAGVNPFWSCFSALQISTVPVRTS